MSVQNVGVMHDAMHGEWPSMVIGSIFVSLPLDFHAALHSVNLHSCIVDSKQS